jgi:MFS family permease
VPEEDLESAVALNSLSLQLARFIGPAIAGFLLASAGPTWVFGVNAFSFLAVLAAIALLPASRGHMTSAALGVGHSMREGLRYVFGQRSIASLMVLMIFAGLFATPPVAFMIPGLVRFQLHEGATTLGLLIALVGLGSVLGSLALLRLSTRANKGEPAIACYLACAAAIAAIGLSTSTTLDFALGIVGGFSGVVFIGLSTVVVQASSSEEMRARAMAIWAACFVGVLPLGGLITAALAEALGARHAAAPGPADIVVNATSVGLDPNIDPFKAIPLKADTFEAGSCVIDLVYGSGETRLLAAARSRGARVIDGLEILVAQGAASFERWTGTMAPRQAMRAAVRKSPSP